MVVEFSSYAQRPHDARRPTISAAPLPELWLEPSGWRLASAYEAQIQILF